MLYDVELLFCTIAESDDLEGLLAAACAASPDERPPLAAALRELAVAELSNAPARWTPHYDAALRVIADIGDAMFVAYDEASEEGWQPYYLGQVRDRLRDHRRICQLLDHAADRGARTLGDAFEVCHLDTAELALWLALVPDPASLSARIHAALIGFLRATSRDSPAPISEAALIAAVEGGLTDEQVERYRCAWREVADDLERSYVIDALATREPRQIWFQLIHAPSEVFERLGNPFRPKATASAWP